MMQCNDICISFAVESDIDGIYRVAEKSSANPWTKPQLEEELLYDFAVLLTAKKDGEVLGFCDLHITAPECHLNEIAVAAPFRRRKAGTGLLDFAIAESQKRGCGYMTLEVRESNSAAVQFYVKRGFKEEGKRSGFYRNPDEDAIAMRLDYTDDYTGN